MKTKLSALAGASRIALLAGSFAAVSASMGGVALAAAGSASGSISAGVTIVTPIAVQQVTALNFGSIALNSTAAGTMTLSTTNVRTPPGSIDAVTSGGQTPAAAQFSVSAQSGYTYAVTLPSSATLSSGTNTVTVNAFTTGSSLSSLTATGSAQTYTVGATLNVPANAAAGTYTGTFTVTAAYN